MSNETNVEWRDIPGYENHYQVSSDGQVRSLDRITKHGRFGYVFRRGKVLIGGFDTDGYRHLLLSYKATRVCRKVHSLIALTFLGPRPEGLQVLHWDDNKLNNHISNLRYGTRQENSTDMRRNGIPEGIQKLTADDVLEIRRLLSNGEPQRSIAKRFGVNGKSISRINRGYAWRHLK